MTDQTPDPMTGGETTQTVPEQTASEAQAIPPAIDHNAVEAATAVHTEAVATAHEGLRTRLESAYATFGNELDNAWSLWENAVKDARIAESFLPQTGGPEHVPSDPTTAR